MSYNLLFDTLFNNKNNYWKFINCKYENGYLISNNKIFGVEQEIVLPDITKLYLRFNYNILFSKVFKVYVGIQNDDKLYINKKWTKQGNHTHKISIVEDTKTEKIKVHLFFESTEEINKVEIKEPILCDLKRLHKTTLLKIILDKTIKYTSGLNYKNILPYSEIDYKLFNLEQAKVGSIISTNKTIKLKINAKLYKDKHYLLKLDYTPINDLGKTYLNYGVIKSTTFNREQEYLLFKHTGDYELAINIEPNDVLPYQLNLKHLMLIEMGGKGIELRDIPYLPFI